MKTEQCKITQPDNGFINALLTDKYQLTMAYGYWFQGRHEEKAVFEMFFRTPPFGGEFAIFAGLEEVLRLIANWGFSDEDIKYLKKDLPNAKPEFFDWLKTADCSGIKVRAMPEGTIVFPKTPLIQIEGPLAVVQLLETTILNLVNFASLMTTNAARFRQAAGPDAKLLEFGLRRAQGPDGGMSASKYSYLGGFDGTSNELAGKNYGIPVLGTHAHSWVLSYTGLGELQSERIVTADGDTVNFVELVLNHRQVHGWTSTNEGELASFIAYAQAFPEGFLALVDTYDTLTSGVPNFLAVAMALHECGYKAIGIRLDSGDLAYLSNEARKMFKKEAVLPDFGYFGYFNIVASNDIDEEILHSLKRQGHEINSFGIGTNLVTCKDQPAFGGVYKLVEINHHPRIKLSQDPIKITIPGDKRVYRLFNSNGQPVIDLIMMADEPEPEVGEPILCQHPFSENKRVKVTPSKVVPLLTTFWDGQITPEGQKEIGTSLKDKRAKVLSAVEELRPDHLRAKNPTPYKVSVSSKLYDFLHQLWSDEAPIPEIS
ncbi:nicotinate phosphoribosyltransferase [Patescibacteria group bacterium]